MWTTALKEQVHPMMIAYLCLLLSGCTGRSNLETRVTEILDAQMPKATQCFVLKRNAEEGSADLLKSLDALTEKDAMDWQYGLQKIKRDAVKCLEEFHSRIISECAADGIYKKELIEPVYETWLKENFSRWNKIQSELPVVVRPRGS